jgi:UDP-N-acetyl-D-galactosamine dehydrogenase
MGLAFKENVPDLRNSRVIDVISRLQALGHDVTVHDPLAEPDEARHEYGIELAADALHRRYDMVLVAVPHAAYQALGHQQLGAMLNEGALLADLKNLYAALPLPEGVQRWTL